MTRGSHQDALERWYRWLLRAYPRRYRSLRGTEMLTTLLDAAEPGQRRPHPRDAVDLLLGGARCRFAVPRGQAYLAVAVVVAAFAGLTAAAAAGRLAWPAAAPEPSLAAAQAAAAVAMPLPQSGPPSRYDDPLALDQGSARVEFSYVAPADRPVADVVRQSHGRLAADGWRVGPLEPGDHLIEFSASKGDHLVQVRGYFGLSNVDSLTVWVSGRVAHWLAPAVGGALCAGAAAGWLLAAWALRRFRRHGLRARLAAGVLAAPGLLATGSALFAGAYQALAVGPKDGWTPHDSLFAAAALAAVGPLAGLAAAALALAAVVVALPVRPDPPAPTPPERAWRYRLWGMAGTHLAFAAAWCTVVVLFLVRGQHLLGPVNDPKELIPFGYHPMNPFMWLYAALALLYLFGFMASPVLLSISVPLLVTGRRVARRAGLWAAWRTLLLAAATAVLLPIMTFTPLGQEATTWWLD
ncbi:hypothetical protein [Phytohabitans rumicis]|uniref:Uncharacterized protein n=1 Tax=Phytohabitans rumicis TaxID=1076125 RepID=A0A6V8LUW7_9ACTN|nr:hypothetical protein [Phytohabitans rumicis]GFJ96575.1 hypothetical protein Prum_102170 [Phytohabitans rumicis]